MLLIFGLILEIKYREHLFKFWKERLLWILISLTTGIFWDMYAIPREHWIFTGRGILGIKIINGIPIEELMWFLIVPYFWITIYHTIHIKFKK
jgi:lycopene cyclase domain-containing protein